MKVSQLGKFYNEDGNVRAIIEHHDGIDDEMLHYDTVSTIGIPFFYYWQSHADYGITHREHKNSPDPRTWKKEDMLLFPINFQAMEEGKSIDYITRIFEDVERFASEEMILDEAYFDKSEDNIIIEGRE